MKHTFDYKNSTLLVIDMQRYFVDRNAHAYFEAASQIIPNINQLIRGFKELSRPVIFTRHAHAKDDTSSQMAKWWDNKLPRDGYPESEIVDEIAKAHNDIVITKTSYSAFEGTCLENILRETQIDTICVCGITTNLCVETTIRHAFIKGYQPVVIEDACAAKTADYHHASILNLSYGFAPAKTTGDVLLTLNELCKKN